MEKCIIAIPSQMMTFLKLSEVMYLVSLAHRQKKKPMKKNSINNQ